MATTSSEFDYPFDPTGLSAANKITNEIDTLTPVNYRDYSLIIPRYAPFFADSLTITFRDTNNTVVPLVEGVDYYLGYWYIGASRACAKPVYGSIQFLNTSLSGTLTISYQTIGGRWTLSEADIAEILADRLENPRVTSWEQVTGVPIVFPVINHVWDLVDQVGLSDINTSLKGIEEQLRQQGTQGLAQHIADKGNPHMVTKDQTGLGNVENLPLAIQTDAEAGVSNDFYMTPLSTMWAMNKNIIIPFNQHAAAKNPHGTTAADVGAYTIQQTDTLLQSKLSSTGTAYDSQRLQGLTYAEVRDAILQGTAANSLKFDGYTFEDYKTYVLQGTAANSLKFNSMTYPDMLTLLDQRYGSADNTAISKLFDYTGAGQGNPVWMLLGQGRLADPSIPYQPYADLQWLVSGLNTDDGVNNATYYLRIALRADHSAANASKFAIINSLDPVVASDQIGWVINADGIHVDIYVKTNDGTNHITVNELSKGMSNVGDGSSQVTTEPVGITYITPLTYVTSDQFITAMNEMKTAFDVLTTELNT